MSGRVRPAGLLFTILHRTEMCDFGTQGTATATIESPSATLLLVSIFVGGSCRYHVQRTMSCTYGAAHSFVFWCVLTSAPIFGVDYPSAGVDRVPVTATTNTTLVIIVILLVTSTSTTTTTLVNSRFEQTVYRPRLSPTLTPPPPHHHHHQWSVRIPNLLTPRG